MSTTYTAIFGNWSDSSSCGSGLVPPAILNCDDIILINPGYTIVIDCDVNLNCIFRLKGKIIGVSGYNGQMAMMGEIPRQELQILQN